MHWMLRPWRHYADFAGRSPRREYWIFVLLFYIMLFVPAIIAAPWLPPESFARDAPLTTAETVLLIVMGVVCLGCFIPGLALAVRRLHDHEKPGVLQLLVLVPAIGWIFVLIYALTPGTEGENLYGPDPRDEENVAGVVSEVFD